MLVAASGGVVGEFSAVTVSGVSKVARTDTCARYKGYTQKQVRTIDTHTHNNTLTDKHTTMRTHPRSG